MAIYNPNKAQKAPQAKPVEAKPKMEEEVIVDLPKEERPIRAAPASTSKPKPKPAVKSEKPRIESKKQKSGTSTCDARSLPAPMVSFIRQWLGGLRDENGNYVFGADPIHYRKELRSKATDDEVTMTLDEFNTNELVIIAIAALDLNSDWSEIIKHANKVPHAGGVLEVIKRLRDFHQRRSSTDMVTISRQLKDIRETSNMTVMASLGAFAATTGLASIDSFGRSPENANFAFEGSEDMYRRLVKQSKEAVEDRNRKAGQIGYQQSVARDRKADRQG